MANKKTFKNNPALQFISSADENTLNNQNTDNTEQASNADNTQYAVNKHNNHYTDITHNTDNKQERKTKRLNLLLQPSILENFSKIAHMKQTSINDLVNSVLKDYIETEAEAISMYDKIFSKKH